ncbi:MAG: carboxypeptidase-like regulatory domain-containing protein [Acidobacteriota bacterium]
MKTLLLLTAGFALAQAPDAQVPIPAKGSISGMVRDFDTGAPVAGADISASNPPARPVGGVTDAQGRFTLSNIDAGRIQLSANAPRIQGAGFPPLARKFVTLGQGQQVESIEVQVRTIAQISGVVTDQNDQPVPDISVFLVAREYQLGELRYIFAAPARTDDQGKYTLNSAPGRTYLLLATRSPGRADAISSAPADPRLRRPSVVPTYYPGVDTVAGAQAITLQSGDKRENLNIKLQRAASLCAEGSLSATGAPGEVTFNYAEASPHSGSSGDGGLFVGSNSGKTEADGKVRICDLHPGQYRFQVYDTPTALGTPATFGTGLATVTDRDGAIVFSSLPKVKVPGEMIWAEEPPASFTIPANSNLIISPLTRAPFREETRATPLQLAPFTMDLFGDDYTVQRPTLPAGVYLKDITYGDKSVLRAPFHPGSAVGDAKLKVILAHDGGTLNAHVADKEGKPMADQFVILLPANITSEVTFADAAISGQTDQNGSWTSASLAPGKYYVLASRTPFDRTPETIGGLWRARVKAKDIEIAPKARVDVTIEPIAIQ